MMPSKHKFQIFYHLFLPFSLGLGCHPCVPFFTQERIFFVPKFKAQPLFEIYKKHGECDFQQNIC